MVRTESETGTAHLKALNYVPMFNVQRLLTTLPAKERVHLLANTRTLLKCNPATFQRIRMAASDPLDPMQPAAYRKLRMKNVDWSPDYLLMRRIAKFFGVTMESLYNDPDANTLQLEIPLEQEQETTH